MYLHTYFNLLHLQDNIVVNWTIDSEDIYLTIID